MMAIIDYVEEFVDVRYNKKTKNIEGTITFLLHGHELVYKIASINDWKLLMKSEKISKDFHNLTPSFPYITCDVVAMGFAQDILKRLEAKKVEVENG